MATSRVISVLVLVFLIALGSGVVIGMKVRPAPEPHGHERSRLTEELKLSPEQQEKMKTIWQEVVRGGGRQGGFDRRRQLGKERDEAIAALITTEQKQAYDAIIERYNQQVAEMNKERETTFQKAVEQTKAMLSPEQRTRYEELLAKGAFGPGRRPSTTQSATAPSRERR